MGLVAGVPLAIQRSPAAQRLFRQTRPVTMSGV